MNERMPRSMPMQLFRSMSSSGGFAGGVDFDHETGEPRTGSLLLQDHALDVVGVRYVTVGTDRYRSDFRKSERTPAGQARVVIHVEAFGLVRHRSKFAHTLPFQPPSLVVILSVCFEHCQIFVDLTDRLLGSVRRYVREGWPLLFPVGQFRVLIVDTRSVVVVRAIVVTDCVVADLSMDVDVSPRFAGGFRVGIRRKRSV